MLSPNRARHARCELMELQRHAMLMYTSCGWFFDDISGIETVQIIAYAGARAAAGRSSFLAKRRRRWRRISSRAWPKRNRNVPESRRRSPDLPEARATMELNLEQVAAHYAISSIFTSYGAETDLFCYSIRRFSR